MDGTGENSLEAIVGRGQRAHYASTDNLEKRQALFTYRDPTRSVGSPPFHRVGWGGSERVLDVGSGNGQWARTLRDRFKLDSIVSLDLSMGMLAGAANLGSGGRLVNADVQALPLASGTFDVVLALWMLYHVADLGRGLSEIRRVLGPGGCLLAATNSNFPNRSDEAFAEALAEVTGRPPSTAWLPGLGFSAENGAEILGSAFDRVESHPVVGALAVPEPDPVIAAMLSVRDVVEASLGQPVDWESVETTVRRAIEGIIAEEGCFSTEIHSTWFVAWP
jgi:SAM-dependent methyltransferase